MLSSRRRRQRAILAALAALGVVVGALSFGVHLLDSSLQAVTYDTFITNAPGKVSDQVTIAALDDRTVARYGTYPLPRQAYADLLQALKPLGPRVVAFDIGFYDESPSPDQDRGLARAITDAGNVILAMRGDGARTVGDGVLTYTGERVPIAILRQAAAGLGSVNVDPDDDGRVRTAPLVIDAPSGRYYSLPLVATARWLQAAKLVSGDESSITRDGDVLVLKGRAPIPDRVMPVDDTGHMAVYYAAPPADDLNLRSPGSVPCSTSARFCVVSMADVIGGKVPRELIANRTVFVGAHSLAGVPDSYPVPNSGSAKMWGVEIWANTAASILTNRYPVLREGFIATLIELVVLTLGGVLLIGRFRLYGFLGAIGLLVAYGYARYVGFSVAGGGAGTGPTAVASFGYLVPAAFWWVVALGYLLVEEETAVRRTQTTFGRFVTPSIARTIMDIAESGKLALGGEEKRVTVLFGDIRGFTGISEGMTPGVLLDTLNRYFAGIVDVVNRYEGTVNKYNGDNIMVIWGAPLPVADQARKGVEAALEIQRWIVAERRNGGPDVSFGFGINTGPVVAGFLGALGRMEYTVIGDTANVASRLTSADIARRDQVVVSAETLAELGADVVTVDLGAVPVKGRAAPVRCYQVDRLGSIASPNPAAAPERALGAAVAGVH